MIKHLLIVWATLVAAFVITDALLSSVEVNGGALTYVWVAGLFGLVNAIIGPLLRLLSIPLLLVTFGLFALVINAVLLGVTAGLTDSLDVGGFLATVGAALLISCLSAALGWIAFRVTTPDKAKA